jgi:hypothetical protein
LETRFVLFDRGALSINYRLLFIRGAGPKTAVQVPKLREILGASETYTVQRREGFTGSYTITAPSFTVVGNAYFFPLTPLHPTEEVRRALRPISLRRSAGRAPLKTPASDDRGVDLSDAPGTVSSPERSERYRSQESRSDIEPQRPFVSLEAIAHAYPHYDVEKGFFPDPLNS